MTSLSPKAKRFLDAHRGAGAPSRAQADRVRAAVDARLALPHGDPSGPPEPSSPPAPTGAAAKLSLLKSLGVGVMAVVAGSTGTLLAKGQFRDAPTRTVTQQSGPIAERTVPPAVAPVVVDEFLPARVETPVVPRLNPRPAPPAPEVDARLVETKPKEQLEPPTLPAMPAGTEIAVEKIPIEPTVRDPPPDAPPEPELALMSRADDQLRSGDAASALKTLDRWSALWAEKGQFQEEARAARIVALCASGALEAGRLEARVYFEQHPGAVQRNRIERACKPAGERE